MEYIAGKSFLFILLEEKSELTLFCVRRSQNFISHTSLISTFARNATPARPVQRSRVTYYFTPFPCDEHVGLGSLSCALTGLSQRLRRVGKDLRFYMMLYDA